MVKLKVSYKEDEELEKLCYGLGEIIKSKKISNSKKRNFKKAYIELIDLRKVEFEE